jgi:hypothetical protein
VHSGQGPRQNRWWSTKNSVARTITRSVVCIETSCPLGSALCHRSIIIRRYPASRVSSMASDSTSASLDPQGRHAQSAPLTLDKSHKRLRPLSSPTGWNNFLAGALNKTTAISTASIHWIYRSLFIDWCFNHRSSSSSAPRSLADTAKAASSAWQDLSPDERKTWSSEREANVSSIQGPAKRPRRTNRNRVRRVIAAFQRQVFFLSFVFHCVRVC